MTPYFLGADLGGTKTRVMIADANGVFAGFGESCPGNHETVGYEGFKRNLNHAAAVALQQAHLLPHQIAGAGFRIAGYYWAIEYQPKMEIMRQDYKKYCFEVMDSPALGGDLFRFPY